MKMDEEQSVSAAALVEKGLPVSWNTGPGPLYWYRVESVCEEPICENGALQYPCPKMTTITTVAAPSIPDLCDILANPSVNTPLRSKILSLRRYTRPVLKIVGQPDECNVLEEVEFCQVPECEDFCSPVPVSLPRSLAEPSRLLIPRFNSLGSDYSFGTELVGLEIASEQEDPIFSESGLAILATTQTPSPPSEGITFSGSANVSCTFFAHQSDGFIAVSGRTYFTSPRGNFIGQGSVLLSGSFRIVKSATASGGLALYGAAHSFTRSFPKASGGVNVVGSASVESPSYFFSSSGVISVSGDANTLFENIGMFAASAEVSASAFSFGVEQQESLDSSLLTISDFQVSACGCANIGPTIDLRHNLGMSNAFSNFLRSEGLSYPSTIPLRYRSSDTSWTSNTHLKGRDSFRSVSLSFGCDDDSWRLSFSVGDGDRSTKFILQIPSDILCESGFVSTSVLAYFNSYSLSGSGVSIPAVSPTRSVSRRIVGSVEAFVDGIFVPHTVYYDDLGLFKDSFWISSPLELSLNPLVANKTTLLDISWA